MKNIKIVLILLAVVLVSCETNYDDYNEDRLPVVGFTTAVGSPNVSIAVGETVIKEYNVFVSDVSDQDRQFNVVYDTSTNTVGAENFTIGMINVPAGSRDGIFELTVTNVSLPETYTAVIFNVDNSDPNYVAGSKASFNMRTAP